MSIRVVRGATRRTYSIPPLESPKNRRSRSPTPVAEEPLVKFRSIVGFRLGVMSGLWIEGQGDVLATGFFEGGDHGLGFGGRHHGVFCAVKCPDREGAQRPALALVGQQNVGTAAAAAYGGGGTPNSICIPTSWVSDSRVFAWSVSFVNFERFTKHRLRNNSRNG